MKRTDLIFAFVLFLCVVSVLPLFTDPYYHRSKVSFWEWLKKELYELEHGEKE